MDTTIALVTGATQGIGRETVRRLASLGWTVWLGARDAEAGEKVAAAISTELTGIASTGIGSTGAASTGIGSTGTAPTGIGSTGTAPTGIGSTGTASTGIGSTDTASTGIGSTDTASTGIAPTGIAPTGTGTSVDIRVVQLDVTDDDSVVAAVRTVEAAHGRLDVLVNNAGVAGGWVSPRDATPADFLSVYGVNVLGPVRMTHAFLPLLDRSAQPRVVMVSSGLGSFGVTTDPARFESTLHNITYPSSKSALNMVASQYAKALDGYQVLIVDPGYTSTAFNGYNGTQTVEQGAESVVQAATSAPDAPTGTYRDAAGPLPW